MVGKWEGKVWIRFRSRKEGLKGGWEGKNAKVM